LVDFSRYKDSRENGVFFDEKSLAREKKSVASSRSSAGGKKILGHISIQYFDLVLILGQLKQKRAI